MKTIFGKQLLLYLGTLTISFVLLGAVLSQIIRTYFINQRVTYLKDSGQRIAMTLEGFVNYGAVDMISLRSQITAMRQYLDAKLVIIDTDYNVLGVSEDMLANSEKPLYAKELEPLMTGEVVVTYGAMDNLYKEPLLTVGYPIKWNDATYIAILISSSMSELEETIAEMYRITLICLGVSAIFTYALIYLSSRAISRPLRQMNDAARIIADGDFEKRISVHTRDEVGQLAESFNNMAESLQEQERIRRAFIANLSHDLRSPLTSMRGFLQAIVDGTVPPEKQPYYLDIIMDESERLIKLSNEVLDLNQIQDADIKIKPEAFDINDLIRKTVMRFEKRALDKGLIISCHFAHETDGVYADPGLMQRVLYNLLDNAVKFTPDQNGEIVIETTVVGSKVSVSVRDNGRGIPITDQKRIFERFYKGDPSRGEDKKGNGLGLSIVKEFMRAHGENITVTSEPGQGSQFTITLPGAEL